VPLHWATTQNNLGNALRALGERESGTGRLEEAIAALRAALEVFEAAQASHYMAVTQGNLARVESLIAERATGASNRRSAQPVPLYKDL
jgi:tetratricopeptide (TPR) repeat protein